MNYYGPRQLQTTKRWNYTCMNDRTGCYAIGYCAGWREWNEETIRMIYGDAESPRYKSDLAERERFREKYHADAHETEEEARKCYQTFILDQELKLRVRTDTQKKCEVCQEFTGGLAEVDMRMFYLCDAHRNRDEVAKLLGDSAGDSISSY